MNREYSKSGIYASEKVRHFANDMGALLRDCIEGYEKKTDELLRVDGRLAQVPRREILRWSLDSVKDWGLTAQEDEAKNAKSLFPTIDKDFQYAFAFYTRNYFGTDQYGNRIPLDLRIPPFHFFIHTFYSVALDYKEIYDIGSLSTLDFHKLTKDIMRKALHKVTEGRVFVQKEARDVVRPEDLYTPGQSLHGHKSYGDGDDGESTDSSSSEDESHVYTHPSMPSHHHPPSAHSFQPPSKPKMVSIRTSGPTEYDPSASAQAMMPRVQPPQPHPSELKTKRMVEFQS